MSKELLKAAEQEIKQDKVEAEEQKQKKIKGYLKNRLNDIENLDKSIVTMEEALQKFKNTKEEERLKIQEKIDKVVSGDTEDVFVPLTTFAAGITAYPTSYGSSVYGNNMVSAYGILLNGKANNY